MKKLRGLVLTNLWNNVNSKESKTTFLNITIKVYGDIVKHKSVYFDVLYSSKHYQNTNISQQELSNFNLQPTASFIYSN